MTASAVLWLGDALRARPQASGPVARGKGTLEIVVIDETGRPLSGVRVGLPGHRARTGPSGSCRFSILPGRYPILISKEGYRGRRINAGVRPGETTNTRVQLQKLSPALPPRK